MRVVAAPDKLRGTATAADVAALVGDAAAEAGWRADCVPMADGGEGTLDALGGANRSTTVTGPLGDLVVARWRLSGTDAVVEMAEASGLELAGGPEENDPVSASTYGTGELIGAAVDAGARRIIVGVGGSATTDGGLGALRALYPLPRLRGIDLVVACDVRTLFVDAAEVFAPQKGASATQVEFLRRRLETLAQAYEREHGVDVREIVGGGAAGGLAGGLAAVGATLMSGFDVVADELQLFECIDGADLVVTAEGLLDAQSFDGKVVGGVVDLAQEAGVPVLAVVGSVDEGAAALIAAADGLTVVSLVETFGEDAAHRDVGACIRQVVADHLSPPF